MKLLNRGTKCQTCLGCNKLEEEDFVGVYGCDSYRKAETKLAFIDNICKKWSEGKVK